MLFVIGVCWFVVWGFGFRLMYCVCWYSVILGFARVSFNFIWVGYCLLDACCSVVNLRVVTCV